MLVIIFGRSGAASELSLPLLARGHKVVLFFVRLAFQPRQSPPNNYCTVPKFIQVSEQTASWV